MAKSGDKRRIEENKTFLQQLKIAIAVANAVFLAACFVLNRKPVSGWHYAAIAFTSAVYYFCYSGLAATLAPHYSSTGEIIYSGADLKTGGVMEYYKDGIFVCIFCQMLGAYTNWAWLALLAIPAYAFYMLWVNVVGPWWNSSSNVEVPESELDRKKREKRERQAARAQKFAGKR